MTIPRQTVRSSTTAFSCRLAVALCSAASLTACNDPSAELGEDQGDSKTPPGDPSSTGEDSSTGSSDDDDADPPGDDDDDDDDDDDWEEDYVEVFLEWPDLNSHLGKMFALIDEGLDVGGAWTGPLESDWPLSWWLQRGAEVDLYFQVDTNNNLMCDGPEIDLHFAWFDRVFEDSTTLSTVDADLAPNVCESWVFQDNALPRVVGSGFATFAGATVVAGWYTSSDTCPTLESSIIEDGTFSFEFSDPYPDCWPELLWVYVEQNGIDGCQDDDMGDPRWLVEREFDRDPTLTPETVVLDAETPYENAACWFANN